ncbi:hypothetical protein GQ55_8G119300 [Panicum hallii var. hallii]|uniref:Uncharacterized protein n=1 Tax=Panicum hallii var. hallii TaxID=1504633 RepID=A0A2T7CMQ4_9POAL|nr:hypothetical protein GQ55_8G119300 [Panicum hallii var. hallii]
MLTKGGQKNPRGVRVAAEPPLHPYEEERLKQCMQNSVGCNNLEERNKTNQRNRDDSESDYDPSQDDTGEADLIDDDIAKVLIIPSSELRCTNKVKFRSRKRVYADLRPTTLTRSWGSNTQPEASLTSSDIHVPPPSHPDVSRAVELGNSTYHTQPAHVDNNTMADGADGITQPVGDNQMTNEGGQERWNRGVNMGHGLQRMSQARRGKLPVVITEGNIRPLVPLVAAKFATKCNIAARNHVPMLKHWKEYNKHPTLINLFMGRLRAKFDIDTNDAIVRNSCLEMMKSAVRQQQHRLNNKYFDPFSLHLVTKTSPVKSTSNELWIDLEACQTNKDNRANIKFHQTTRSSGYLVFLENLVREPC